MEYREILCRLFRRCNWEVSRGKKTEWWGIELRCRGREIQTWEIHCGVSSPGRARVHTQHPQMEIVEVMGRTAMTS